MFENLISVDEFSSGLGSNPSSLFPSCLTLDMFFNFSLFVFSSVKCEGSGGGGRGDDSVYLKGFAVKMNGVNVPVTQCLSQSVWASIAKTTD